MQLTLMEMMNLIRFVLQLMILLLLLEMIKLSAKKEMIYWDHVGNSAEGHTFPDVLDDGEKKAVMEYLKTL